MFLPHKKDFETNKSFGFIHHSGSFVKRACMQGNGNDMSWMCLSKIRKCLYQLCLCCFSDYSCSSSKFSSGFAGSHRKGRYIPLAALVRRLGAKQMLLLQKDLLKQVMILQSHASTVYTSKGLMLSLLLRQLSKSWYCSGLLFTTLSVLTGRLFACCW